MADPRRGEEFEELLASCLEAQAAGGAEALEVLLAQHPADALRLRERLAQLARLGLVGEDHPRLGPYRVVGRLGAGGMGVVHRARDEDGAEVALKVLPPASDARSRERFEREIHAIASLDHPGIVRVVDVGEADARPYLALELVRGATLSDLLAELRADPPGFDALTGAHLAEALRTVSARRGDPVEPVAGAFDRPWAEVVCRLVADVADALEHAHRAGVVHRDVKPSNVFVDAEGRARLFDFGLAHLVDADSLTRTGDFAGTPYYTSPEQLSGARDLDGRTDVFALGATLYELLCLRRPFEGEGAAAVFRAIQSSDPAPPRRVNPEVPGDLETVTLTTLAKERGQRYASAAALAEDLRRFLAFRPVLARPIGLARRLVRAARRSPGWAAAIGLLAVGLVALPAFLLWANSAIRTERDRAEDSARLSASVVEYLVGLFEGVAGEERTARELLDEGVERLPAIGDQRVRAALYEASGRAYALMGLPRQAIPLFDRAFQLAARELGSEDAEGGRPLELLARAHIAVENWAVAADICRVNLEALESPARRAEVRVTLGHALLGAGDTASARLELEGALDVLRQRAADEPTAAALRLLARVDLATERPGPALEQAQEAWSILASLWSPSRQALGECLAVLQQAHAACGDDAAAARIGERAQRLGAPSVEVPPPPFALLPPVRDEYQDEFQAGISALQAERWYEAQAAFERCLALVPDEPVCAYNIACALSRAGDADAAFSWFERAADWGFGDVASRLRVAEEDPEVASLRARPEWSALDGRMRAGFERAATYASTPAYLAGASPDAPLLVVLHDDGATKASILEGPWGALARARGWALLAPSAVYAAGREPETGMAWTHNVVGFGRDPAPYVEPAREALLWVEREHGTPTGPVVVAGEGAGGWLAFVLATQLPGRVAGVVLRGSAPHPRSLGADARLAEALELGLHVVLDEGLAPYGVPEGSDLPVTLRRWEEWLRASWRGPLSVHDAAGDVGGALDAALEELLR